MNTRMNSHGRGLSALLAVTALTVASVLPAFATAKKTCELPVCPLTATMTDYAKQTAASTRDYLVTVGKRTVMASTLALRPPAPVVSAVNRDYPVLVGKRTMMASQVEKQPTAPPSTFHCPAGRFVTTGKATHYETACPLKGTANAVACCS